MNILGNLLQSQESMATMYKLFGREPLTRALVGVFGNQAKLQSIANKNKDDVQELVAKRDLAISALLDFAEEVANCDFD